MPLKPTRTCQGLFRLRSDGRRTRAATSSGEERYEGRAATCEVLHPPIFATTSEYWYSSVRLASVCRNGTRWAKTTKQARSRIWGGTLPLPLFPWAFLIATGDNPREIGLSQEASVSVRPPRDAAPRARRDVTKSSCQRPTHVAADGATWPQYRQPA